MLKGVIFDFDGVIVDTESKKFAEIRKILKAHGYSLRKKDFSKFIGKKTEFFIKENFPNIKKKVLRDTLNKRKKMQYANLKKNELIAGVRNLLDYLKSRKYKIAITTGSKKDFVKKILKFNGLQHYFDVIITGEDFTSSKPNPECYNITLRRMNSNARDIIVIEDSAAGIKSAKKTGATVFALSTYLRKKNLMGADKQFKTHLEILRYLKRLN